MSPVYVHHALLHFPIGLLGGAGILALVGLWKRSSFLDQAVLLLVSMGILSGIVAAITGLLSAGHLIVEGEATAAVVNSHRNAALLGMLTAAIGLVLLWLARRNAARDAIRITGQVLIIAAAGLILLASHRGGIMVHSSITPFAREHTHEHGEAHSDHDATLEHDEMHEPEHGEAMEKQEDSDHSHEMEHHPEAGGNPQH